MFTVHSKSTHNECIPQLTHPCHKRLASHRSLQKEGGPADYKQKHSRKMGNRLETFNCGTSGFKQWDLRMKTNKTVYPTPRGLCTASSMTEEPTINQHLNKCCLECQLEGLALPLSRFLSLALSLGVDGHSGTYGG